MGVGRGKKLRGERAMDEMLTRMWGDLVGRIGGPMSFRLVLQPLVAIVLAIRAGARDAREGRPLYFWTILTNPGDRRALLESGWKAVVRVFILAVLIDGIYQVLVFRWFYPVEALVVAFLLACVPYLAIRGPVNRLLRPRHALKGT
jgi:hypothetical protein